MDLVAALLGEADLHQSADHRLVGIAYTGQQVALEMHAATLRPSWALLITIYTPRSPRRVRDLRKSAQKVSASEGMTVILRILPPIGVDRHGHYHRLLGRPARLQKRGNSCPCTASECSGR